MLASIYTAMYVDYDHLSKLIKSVRIFSIMYINNFCGPSLTFTNLVHIKIVNFFYCDDTKIASTSLIKSFEADGDESVQKDFDFHVKSTNHRLWCKTPVGQQHLQSSLRITRSARWSFKKSNHLDSEATAKLWLKSSMKGGNCLLKIKKKKINSGDFSFEVFCFFFKSPTRHTNTHIIHIFTSSFEAAKIFP